MYRKIKAVLQEDAVFYGILLTLIAVASFGLGQWSVSYAGVDQPPASVTLSHSPAAEPISALPVTAETAELVASKNGTKYHRLDCPGAKQIAEHNKIYFTSITEAESSGYTLAGNCSSR